MDDLSQEVLVVKVLLNLSPVGLILDKIRSYIKQKFVTSSILFGVGIFFFVGTFLFCTSHYCSGLEWSI